MLNFPQNKPNTKSEGIRCEMNFESLKLGFKEYLKKNAELSEEKYELESNDVSIFMYTDEFKNYLEDELNCNVTDFKKSLKNLSKYEIKDGELVEKNSDKTSKKAKNSEEEASDSEIKDSSITSNEDITDENKEEISDSADSLSLKDVSPEDLKEAELVTGIINDLLQSEDFKKVLDRDEDDKITTEELQEFFESIKDNDDNDKDISLEDILKANEDIKENKFKFKSDDENEKAEEIKDNNSANSVNSNGSNVVSNSPVNNSGQEQEEKTLENMSIDELEQELNTKKTALNENQELLTSIINESYSEISDMKNTVQDAYDKYQEELKKVDEDMAKELDDKQVEITEKEDEINKNDVEIITAEADVNEAQNTYDSLKSQVANMEGILQSLKSTDSSAMDDTKKAELQSQIAEVQAQLDSLKEAEETAKVDLESKKENLDALNETKNTLEEDLAELNNQKTDIETKISEKYPEVQEYMDNYNELKKSYDETKTEAVNAIKGDIDTNQQEIANINEAITNAKNKESTKEYSFGQFGEEVSEYARQFLGYNESDGSANLFLGGGSSSATPWCAAFVEYVLENSNQWENVPDWYKNCSNKWYCPTIYDYASAAGAIIDSSEVQAGDLVIFGSDQHHIGIITGVEGNTVYTIEGNSSNAVNERQYDINDASLNFCKMT